MKEMIIMTLLYIKIFLIVPLSLSVIFHLFNFIAILLNKRKKSENIDSRIKLFMGIYTALFSLLIVIAFFNGFYKGLVSVTVKQSGYLFFMYLLTFIFIYTLQYILSKLFKNIILSNTTFRKIIYTFAFIISVISYGVVPIVNSNSFSSHMTVWNNALTTLIIFDVLTELIILKNSKKS